MTSSFNGKDYSKSTIRITKPELGDLYDYTITSGYESNTFTGEHHTLQWIHLTQIDFDTLYDIMTQIKEGKALHCKP